MENDAQSAERKRQQETNLYEERVDEMHTNIGKFLARNYALAKLIEVYLLAAHFEHHGDPKIKKRATTIAKSTGMTTKALFPDRLETLKDDNIRLKAT